MADITIDATGDDVGVVNIECANLSGVTIAMAGISIDLTWVQAAALHRALRGFFEDDDCG